MTVGSGLLEAKTSSREQRLEFDLVGTSRTVVLCVTPGGRMTCQLGSSPAGCISI
jgi:hypothetical protein